MYCIVANRLDISQNNLLDFPTKSLALKKFFPLQQQQQPKRKYKRAQIFILKWSAIEEKKFLLLHLKLLQNVSVYFMKLNEKRRLETATLRMLVPKLIMKMQVGV